MCTPSSIIMYTVSHAYIQQIHSYYKLPFTLSNKVKLLERMQSLGLCMGITPFTPLHAGSVTTLIN